MLSPYKQKIESQMKELYGRLPEKSRRLYAGIEALKLERGGVSYIANLFSCSRNTVLRGIEDLNNGETVPQDRNRKTGAGRKSALEKYPDIDDAFLLILKENTAGDPMNEKVKWTNLSRVQIAKLLTEKGFKVSRHIVKKLLKKHGYVKRQALKKSQVENISTVMPNLKISQN